MNHDKVKIIVMNIEMLLSELKHELNDVLKNDVEEYQHVSPPVYDYDEIFNE